MKIRKVLKADIPALVKLYRSAAKSENGIARKPAEISKKLIEGFIKNSLKSGLIFVIENEEKLVAEIHCYRFEPSCFKHVLGNLILVVDPAFQGQGLGRKIFSHLLAEISKKHHDIARVELFVRENNFRGIKLYKSLGFVSEGIYKNRILDSKNQLSSDTMMAWFNPQFKK